VSDFLMNKSKNDKKKDGWNANSKVLMSVSKGDKIISEKED
jgi:hypothetical protein